ncbi:uncharacterized protein LTHEOB_8388 [Neofusicoccum parvum]|uniref:Uncharacterized protein LTHEOB_8388 n=1 Tax=Neofusicoccum parvum TaxID=310453 RepID=A0ACB5SJM0_9PEZI|nr:uncharacterized protein LTHEOB_8388 [Neofusicoccum parvum]
MKTYFLPPSTEIAPDGLIKLGNIIISPRLVEEPINSGPPPEIPPALRQADHIEENWSWERESHHAFNGGVWASFLQLILGVGADVGGGASRSAREMYSAARLTTTRFRPNLDYVKQAVAADDVQDYLKGQNLFRHKDMYMVTAVKISSGAFIARRKSRDRNANFSPVVDGTTVAMMPISAGFKVEGSRGGSDTRSAQVVNDIVFAYQLRQIRVKKKGEEESITNQQFTDGAFYNLDDMDIDDESTEEIEFEIAEFADEDSSGSEVGMGIRLWDAVDDNEAELCQVAVLPR